MHVLFLDFDGCLHRCELLSSPLPSDRPDSPADIASDLDALHLFEWLYVLEDLLHPHDDVYIVVYSPWRYLCSHRQIAQCLGTLRPRYLGVTPCGQRYDSIRRWLHAEPEVISYRILDLAVAGDLAKPPAPTVIACDPQRGVSCHRVQAQLQSWLLGETKATSESLDASSGGGNAALRRKGPLHRRLEDVGG
ncbi:HAD domain-containing protein [Caldimonas brevitalea]|uniref:FCP1 homology domain-containing protein n=1 Tax=Caldimonas brevitalea TaxID=413882 RepID=A0A0G3BJZ9_9BURK|nr:HAD domain-containing protein [Caldimonas brevitalea]AKJ26850.1 hypothetical protein AAW51_0159 [Caldimonas brevitalea]